LSQLQKTEIRAPSTFRSLTSESTEIYRKRQFFNDVKPSPEICAMACQAVTTNLLSIVIPCDINFADSALLRSAITAAETDCVRDYESSSTGVSAQKI